MHVSQRKIADGLGEMSRFKEHKKEQSQRKARRATSSQIAHAHATLMDGLHSAA
jgi:hypothetical protein